MDEIRDQLNAVIDKTLDILQRHIELKRKGIPHSVSCTLDITIEHFDKLEEEDKKEDID